MINDMIINQSEKTSNIFQIQIYSHHKRKNRAVKLSFWQQNYPYDKISKIITRYSCQSINSFSQLLKNTIGTHWNVQRVKYFVSKTYTAVFDLSAVGARTTTLLDNKTLS